MGRRTEQARLDIIKTLNLHQVPKTLADQSLQFSSLEAQKKILEGFLVHSCAGIVVLEIFDMVASVEITLFIQQ